MKYVSEFTDLVKHNRAVTAVLTVLLAALIVFPFINYGYKLFIMSILLYVFLYTYIAQSWNLLGGFTGLFSLGHSAFFGIGAYATIIAVVIFEGSLITGILAGFVLTTVLAFIVGQVSAKLKGFYFAIATLALVEILRNVAIQWSTLTKGPIGINLPGGYAVDKTIMYFVALAMVVAGTLLVFWIRKSRLGTMCVCIRENERLAEAIGINTSFWKTVITIISANMAMLGGVFFAMYVNSAAPETAFAVDFSMKLLVVVILGGSGTVLGPLLGSVIILLEQILNAWLGGAFAGLSLTVYGVIMVVAIIFAPKGVLHIFDSGKDSDYRLKEGERDA